MSIFRAGKKWLSGFAGGFRASPDPSVAAEPPAKIIAGLGNPGPKYVSTRHNIGFRVVETLAAADGAEWHLDADLDALCAWVRLAEQRVLLLKPQTFMNRSGASLAAAAARWPALDPAADLLIVYDDLDLPLGQIRLRPSGGAGGHNGIADVMRALDAEQERRIPRLRFGIGRPAGGVSVLDWVLGNFSVPDEEGVLPASLERAAEAATAFSGAGIKAAMDGFNRAPNA